MNRRQFLGLGAVSAVSSTSILSACGRLMSGKPTASGASENAARFSLRIAPVKVEIASNQFIQTVGYNGSAPGPLLRVNEGQQVIVDVQNESDVAELVHWHGNIA